MSNNHDSITRFDDATMQDPGKDPFLWHHAVHSLVKDGATGVTFLPDLGCLQKRLTHDQPGPDWKRWQFDSLCCDILGKVSGLTSSPRACIFAILSIASRLTWRCQGPACASPIIPCSTCNSARSVGVFLSPMLRLVQTATTFPDSTIILLSRPARVRRSAVCRSKAK